MREDLFWIGKWNAEFLGQRYEVSNRITNAGFDWFLDLWLGVGAPGFKYIALGASDTPVEYTDTQLGSEQIRKEIQSFNKAQPVLESIVTFLDTEANFTIKEIGLFAGDTATADPDTGILVARAVVNIEKTNVGSLKIIREDRLGRA